MRVKDLNGHLSKEDIQMVNKYMKRCSTLLIIREKSIKTTMRYHLTLVRMAIIKRLQTINAGEGMEKRGPSCIAGGSVNWYSHYGRWYGDSLKNIKPPYGSAIPLLGIYPEETKIEKDICIPLFIAALFTTARTWKQPRCPLTDEWIKKMYKYTMKYYSSIKKNEIKIGRAHVWTPVTG